MYIGIFVGFLVFFILCDSFYSVEQGKLAIMERFGKFYTVGYPGLNFKLPFVDKQAGFLLSTIWNVKVNIETKTFDNVFVNIEINTLCKNIPGKELEAYYLISMQGLQSYISDAVRAIAPQYTLDRLFLQKDELAKELQNDLSNTFQDFGYKIINTLIVELDPDERVKHAMNEINEAQRLRVAAAEKAEAEKIAVVKAAEAQAESKILQGKGIAGQRKAIIEGLRDSLEELKQNSEMPISEQDAITLLLVNQYFDTLKDIGSHTKTSAIFLNHNPGGLNDIMQQIKSSITEASITNQVLNNK